MSGSSISDPSSLIRVEARTNPSAFVHSPLVDDLAELSTAAYLPAGGAMQAGAIPAGYTLLSRFTAQSSQTGFAAYAYQDGAGNIVVAIRGTDITGLSPQVGADNVLADVGFAESTNPFLSSDITQAVALIGEVRAAYPTAQITLTGHSLGGGIADIIAAGSGLNAVTFNAPQVDGILSSYAGDAAGISTGLPPPASYDNIVNIRSIYDPVSEVPLGGQAGEVITINTAYSPDPAVDHSIAKIDQQLQSKSGATVLSVMENPTGGKIATSQLGELLLNNADAGAILRDLMSGVIAAGLTGGSSGGGVDPAPLPGSALLSFAADTVTKILPGLHG
jgi:hypothetical protein